MSHRFLTAVELFGDTEASENKHTPTTHIVYMTEYHEGSLLTNALHVIDENGGNVCVTGVFYISLFEMFNVHDNVLVLSERDETVDNPHEYIDDDGRLNRGRATRHINVFDIRSQRWRHLITTPRPVLQCYLSKDDTILAAITTDEDRRIVVDLYMLSYGNARTITCVLIDILICEENSNIKFNDNNTMMCIQRFDHVIFYAISKNDDNGRYVFTRMDDILRNVNTFEFVPGTDNDAVYESSETHKGSTPVYTVDCADLKVNENDTPDEAFAYKSNYPGLECIKLASGKITLHWISSSGIETHVFDKSSRTWTNQNRITIYGDVIIVKQPGVGMLIGQSVYSDGIYEFNVDMAVDDPQSKDLAWTYKNIATIKNPVGGVLQCRQTEHNRAIVTNINNTAKSARVRK